MVVDKNFIPSTIKLRTKKIYYYVFLVYDSCMHMAAEFGPRNGGFVFFLLKKNTGKTPWKVDDISVS